VAKNSVPTTIRKNPHPFTVEKTKPLAQKPTKKNQEYRARLAAGISNNQYSNSKKLFFATFCASHPVIPSKTFFFVSFVIFCAKKQACNSVHSPKSFC